MDINHKAFLDTIAYSEGTLGKGDDGYNVLFGGGLFTSYATHPHKLVEVNGWRSTAAGRYQLLGRYYKPYADLLCLPDFSPRSQDAIALQQIKECNAFDLIGLGDFDAAITRCARIWASFPGNDYHQPQHAMGVLRNFWSSRLSPSLLV